MPSMQGTFSLLTLTSTPNVFAGQVYEYIPYNALVEIGVVQSATGCIMSIACDTDIVVQDVGQVNIPIKSTPPVYPDDFQPGFACAGGSRLFLAIRNPTAGTLTGFYSARISPL
jgi:hypothetical protein